MPNNLHSLLFDEHGEPEPAMLLILVEMAQGYMEWVQEQRACRIAIDDGIIARYNMARLIRDAAQKEL